MISTSKSILGLIICLAITFAMAFMGSRFMPGDWYAQLAKPSWNPPNAVFAPVWTILYLLMSISAWLVWKSSGLSRAKLPLLLYIIQLILNSLWSFLFFGLHNIRFAFIDIIALWCFILITLLTFWKHNKLAGALFIPYLLWVSFASALNSAILSRN